MSKIEKNCPKTDTVRHETVTDKKNLREKILDLRDNGRYQKYIESLEDYDSIIITARELMKNAKEEKVKLGCMKILSENIAARENMLKKIPIPPNANQLQMSRIFDEN